MSLRLSSPGFCLTLILLGAASLVFDSANAQGISRRGRAIEFSETNNTEVLSKLNQLQNKNEAGNEPADWNRAFQYQGIRDQASYAPGGQYVSPSNPRVSNRKMKDLLERQKNWNVTSDDLFPGNSRDGWLQSPSFEVDEKDRNKSSLKQFSDFYERKDRTLSSDVDKDDDERKPAAGGRDLSSMDDPSVPSAIRNSSRHLRKLLGDDSEKTGPASGEARSSFEDFFGLGHGPTAKELQAQKTSIQKYRNDVLGTASIFSPAGSPSNPMLNPLAPPDSSHASYLGGMESLASKIKPELGALQAATFSSVLSPAMPDLNAKAINQWNPFYDPP